MYEEDIQLKASQVELLVDASKGAGRMALAQPPGTKAAEVLDFTDATAGKTCQMHNQGLFDEYRNVVIGRSKAGSVNYGPMAGA